jgi:hypothetical protein
VQSLTHEARQLWTWLAGRYLYKSRDRIDSAFYYEASVAYSQAAGVPLQEEPHVHFSGGPGPRLDPTAPAGSVAVSLHFESMTKDSAAQLRIVNPDDAWLQITPSLAGPRGGPWPIPAVDSSQNETTIAFQVTLRLAAERAGPPPRGFLVQIDLAGRTFFYPVPVAVRPTPRVPELVLSNDPAQATNALGDLRLRPTGVPEPYYLYVHNPTDKVQQLTVDLAPGGQSTKVIALAKSTQRVFFLPAPPPPPVAGSPAVPGVPVLPDLNGPLEIRLRDSADPNTVFDTRLIRVAVAPPREYVRLASVAYNPPSANGPNQLRVGLEARRTLAGPPCNVQLVLPPQRIPGFLGAQSGTFNGVLPPTGALLQLFAAGLRFSEGAPDNGFVYVNVDTYARAFILRTTFARTGDPTTPEEDLRPALRLRADPIAASESKFPVTVEVDHAPAGATLELSLGHLQDGTFIADRVRKLPTARRERIGFQPAGPSGALLFDAAVQDWTVTFDTAEIVGARSLRARLFGADRAEILEVTRPVTLADRAPADVQFVNPPVQALRGAPLALQAMGFGSGADVQKVQFFVGRPADGKVPPSTPTTPGTAVNGNPSLWGATLPLPLTALGPTDVSVQFVNSAGLSAFATTTVEVFDKLPPVFGTIRGTVFEGPRPQPGLEVALLDEKGMPVKDDKGVERKVKTTAEGTFVFEKVLPGNYKVFVSKPSSGRKAEKAVGVEPGQTVTVTLELFL